VQLIETATLADGQQRAEEVAGRLIDFLDEARESLAIALYDVRLPGAIGDRVAGALRSASGRGVSVRLVYNTGHGHQIPVPAPPKTRPELIEDLPFPTRDIPGVPDLMHHKYVVRDGNTVWSGSTNWTIDSWQRQENAIVVVSSEAVAAAFLRNFDELWETRNVARSGHGQPDEITVGDATVRAWFCPGHGRALAHRISHAIDHARRVRVASPVISSGPILGTLAQVISDRSADIAGMVDATQIAQVFDQWELNGNAEWKYPLLARVVSDSHFTGKHSTPWHRDSVHDFMHAKITVADDTTFVGSFNLSRSGEENAENVLEIKDAGIAEQLSVYIDEVRARFPPLESPVRGSARGSTRRQTQ
jgi:phosphatidylserine/phosphatidylglycerophosphate/cardiolipin synthase-like enzyme